MLWGILHQSTAGDAERKITLCDVTCRSQAFTLSTLSSFRLFPAMTALRFDANLFNRDVHLMRSPARHTRRQDDPMRMSIRLSGIMLLVVVFAEAVMSPDRGRAYRHGCALRQSKRSK